MRHHNERSNNRSGFTNVRHYTTLHSCSSDDVPYSQLATDLAHDQLPAFSVITPNLIDDMHDGTVADGDTWLSRNLSQVGEDLTVFPLAYDCPSQRKNFVMNFCTTMASWRAHPSFLSG